MGASCNDGWRPAPVPALRATMRITSFLATASILPALLCACGGGSDSIGFFGDDGAPGAAGLNGANALVTVSAEAAGANCAIAGSKVEAGLDTDRNGTLAVTEVSSTQYLCNGAAGATGSAGAAGPAGATGSNGLNTLVQMLDEPSGANCAMGGKAINVGTDGNANGVLEAGEVSGTGYVCNGSNGTAGTNGTNGTDGTNGTNGLNTLLSIANEPAGANCVYGGNKVSTGTDANVNSVLDAGEVSATSYVCNGAPGATLSWVNVTGTNQDALPNTGYIASNDTAQVVVTLPASAALAIGDVVRVSGAGSGGWKIAQNAGQAVNTVNLGGAASTTVGSSGSISGGSTDAIELQYVGVDLFTVLSHAGSLTVQ